MAKASSVVYASESYSTLLGSENTPARQADIIVGVNVHLHVETTADFRNVEHQDALDNDHVCWLNTPSLCRRPLVRGEVIHWHIHCLHGLAHQGTPLGTSQLGLVIDQKCTEDE